MAGEEACTLGGAEDEERRREAVREKGAVLGRRDDRDGGDAARGLARAPVEDVGKAHAVPFDEPFVVSARRDGLAVREREDADERPLPVEGVADARAPRPLADDAQVAAEVEEEGGRGVGGTGADNLPGRDVHREPLGDRAEVEGRVRAAARDAERAQGLADAGIEGVPAFRRQAQGRSVAGPHLGRGGGHPVRAAGGGEAAQFGIRVPGGEEAVEPCVGRLHDRAQAFARRRVAPDGQLRAGAHHGPAEGMLRVARRRAEAECDEDGGHAECKARKEFRLHGAIRAGGPRWGRARPRGARGRGRRRCRCRRRCRRRGPSNRAG